MAAKSFEQFSLRSAMGLITTSITRALTVSLGVFWASIVCIRFFFYTLFNPYAQKFWHVKQRDTPPSALNDPTLGTHKYIQLKEVKIHYVEKGDNTKPLMLFVHGFPEIWYSWRHQMEEFSKDYWTVALDMRGYGDSDKPSGVTSYRMENLVNDIKEFIEAMGRDKCILVAHDWGGVVAWQFVRKYPEMLEKYIIMDAPHPKGFRRHVLTSRSLFLKFWYVFFFQLPYLPEIFMRSYDMKHFANMINNRDSKSKKYITDEDIEIYKHIFGKPGAYTAPINYYRANLNRRNLINLSTDHKDLPGLLISGEKSGILSSEMMDLAKISEPCLKVEIVKGANHFLQQDDPNAVNEMIRNFLKD